MGVLCGVLSCFGMRNTRHFQNASLTLLLAVGAACASTKAAEVKDDQLTQLPREDRQAIIDQERSVDTAKANVDAARVAAKQAHDFKDLVDNEVTAAKAKRDAADNSVGYDSTKKSQNDLNAKRAVANQEVAAAEAKAEYASKLIEVREAEVEAREADAELAQAKVERAKYETLQRRGMAEGINRQEIVDAEVKAEQKRAAAQQKVAQLQGYADASKVNWDKAQTQYQDSAKATVADDRPVQPPAAAKYLTVPPVNSNPTAKDTDDDNDNDKD